MASLRGAGLVAAMSLTVSLVVIIVLVGLGLAVPAGTNPFFYFALILFGGGAFGLLFAGVGEVFARARTPTVPSADLDFFAGVRRLALAMWLCALVTDALGVLIVLALTGRTGDTPLGTGTLITAFTVAAVTFICTGVSSVVMRRLLPRR